MIIQSWFPIVLGHPHVVVCPWRQGAGEEVRSLIWVCATPAHPRRRGLTLGLVFLPFIVPAPRRDPPHCHGIVTHPKSERTEKTTHHDPKLRTDDGPDRFRCSIFVKGWLLLGSDGVKMCGLTVRALRERASENLFYETAKDEMNDHGQNGSASTC